jgi:hypothetical protein
VDVATQVETVLKDKATNLIEDAKWFHAALQDEAA